MGLFGRKKKTPTPEEFRENRTFDYSTPESRVLTAEWLLTDVKNNRAVVESEWVKYNDYYNFIRGATDEVRESIRESGILFILRNDCITMMRGMQCNMLYCFPYILNYANRKDVVQKFCIKVCFTCRNAVNHFPCLSVYTKPNRCFSITNTRINQSFFQAWQKLLCNRTGNQTDLLRIANRRA